MNKVSIQVVSVTNQLRLHAQVVSATHDFKLAHNNRKEDNA